MKFPDFYGSVRRIAAYFVNRGQREVSIKGRILYALGYYGACNLLESSDEQSPLGAVILGGHPAFFAGFILIWVLIVVLLVARLRHPWNKAMALAVVVGHTAGIYGWLVLRNYWYTIPTFILVGILTVACWQKAEAAR